MVVATFNQEKALVGAFSVIVQLHRLIVNSTTRDIDSVSLHDTALLSLHTVLPSARVPHLWHRCCDYTIFGGGVLRIFADKTCCCSRFCWHAYQSGDNCTIGKVLREMGNVKMEELYNTLFYPPSYTKFWIQKWVAGSARRTPATEGCITYACAGNRNGMETHFFGDAYAVPRM